jgi:2,3-dihydroxybenzoate decarboxylase
VNNRLHSFVESRPDRFSAFASLPMRDPDACPDELERCVKELGFKGAMIHGLTDGKFPDMPEFWPIFARAEALDVPIYIHPGPPHPAVVEAYYKEYVEKFRSILSAGWGFTVETATSGLRLVLSGVLDKHPDVKIILGHMGEGLPFLLWRINHSFSKLFRPEGENVAFRDLFCKHFYITTSGNFSNPALLCSVMELGVDRILFSVDWPYVQNAPGTAWMEGIPLSDEDREKILNGNAKRLLKM